LEKFPISIFLFLFSTYSFALVGGMKVNEQDPLSKSVVALQMVEKDSIGKKINRYKGSGVLVGKDVILTAGHNFFYIPDVSLCEAIFSIEPKWGEESNGQTRISVKRVEIFPGFTQTSSGTFNDLALVFLSRPVPSDYAPLQMELEGNEPPEIGENGVLLGFGRSQNLQNQPLSDFQLRKLELPFNRWDFVSIFDSQKIWFSNTIGSITGGDSGGPVLFKRNGLYRIYGIGIHLRYDGCVENGTCEGQSAYTNLTYFSKWIKNTLFKEAKSKESL